MFWNCIPSQSNTKSENERTFITTPKSKYTEIVQVLLKTNNFAKIIKSDEFFWSLYCLIQRKQDIDCDNYVGENDMFKYLGLDEGTRKIIKFIREQLVEFLESREENKLCYSGYSTCAQKLYNYNGTKKVQCHHFFVDYVLPFLEKLINAVGFSYSCDFHNTYGVNGDLSSMVHYTITLKNKIDSYRISIVTPLVIPNYNSEGLYKTYKQGMFADFTLSAIGGELKVNSYFLYSTSTNVMKLIVAGDFQESENKHAHFPEYSITTLKVYIEFLYLGNKLLDKEYFHLLEDCDFTELLNFGHIYEDKCFFDFCVNLFGFFANKGQCKDLIEMSDYYHCDQLKKISEKLNKEEIGEEEIDEEESEKDTEGKLELINGIEFEYYKNAWHQTQSIGRASRISTHCDIIHDEIFPLRQSEKVIKTPPKYIQRQIRRLQYCKGAKKGGNGKVKIC